MSLLSINDRHYSCGVNSENTLKFINNSYEDERFMYFHVAMRWDEDKELMLHYHEKRLTGGESSENG